MSGGQEQQVGELAGHVVLGRIGSGMLGEVLLGRRAGAEPVALKRLRPSLTKEFGDRFAASMAGAGKVAPITVLPTRGEVVAVRPYFDGESVGSLARRRNGRFPPAEALRIVQSAAGEVGRAHDQGVLHGALHAEHVLVSSNGQVCVLDFNLAELRREVALSLGLGAPTHASAYEAPEANFAPTPEADVWALGALLYLLLSGRAPAAFEDPRSEDAPSKLAEVLERALAPSVPERYGSPHVLAAACQAARAHPAVANLGRLRFSSRPPERVLSTSATVPVLASDLALLDLDIPRSDPAPNIADATPRRKIN